MKRKSFVSILIVLLALFSLTRCKLAEVETIDEIPCPGVGIDTVIIPAGTISLMTKTNVQPFRAGHLLFERIKFCIVCFFFDQILPFFFEN